MMRALSRPTRQPRILGEPDFSARTIESIWGSPHLGADDQVDFENGVAFSNPEISLLRLRSEFVSEWELLEIHFS